jgi:hypothetical protein
MLILYLIVVLSSCYTLDKTECLGVLGFGWGWGDSLQQMLTHLLSLLMVLQLRFVCASNISVTLLNRFEAI